MPSDQQRMYDHASNLVTLLASNLPEEQVVSEIGEIVVRGLSLSASIILWEYIAGRSWQSAEGHEWQTCDTRARYSTQCRGRIRPSLWSRPQLRVEAQTFPYFWKWHAG